MEWSPPTFEEVPMNAEIGGYQGDDDTVPIVVDEREDAE
jgi:hypothetical protein